MRVYIFTAALLLSFTTLATGDAEADFNPPPLTPETLDILGQGIRYGTFRPFLHSEMSPEQQKAYDIMVTEARSPITTPEGQHEWLNPVGAIAQAAVTTPVDQLFNKAPTTFPASLMDSFDPYKDFRQRMEKGIFVAILDRGSLQAHHYLSIMNSHQDTPNFYVTINDLSGLGSFDKAFQLTSYHPQLSAVDPTGSFQRLAKFMPETSAASPAQEASFFKHIFEWFKTLNAVAIVVNADMPDAPYGAEE